MPFESKDKMVDAIKAASDSMYPNVKRVNVNQFPSISPRQAIITINGVDQEQANTLLDQSPF